MLKLTAFDKQVVVGLAYKAGLAAGLFDAWADLPDISPQSVRTLVDLAQLGVTEERAAREVLEKSVELGLVELTPSGYRPREGAHVRFRRLAVALNAIDYYVSFIHKDATVVRVVLTKPLQPSKLEHQL